MDVLREGDLGLQEKGIERCQKGGQVNLSQFYVIFLHNFRKCTKNQLFKI